MAGSAAAGGRGWPALSLLAGRRYQPPSDVSVRSTGSAARGSWPAPILADMSADTDEGERSPRAVFWRIQITAWLVFGLVYYLAVVPLAGRDPLRLLVFKLFWALTGVAVSSLLAVLFTRAGLARRDPATALALAEALAIPLGLLWVAALGGLVRVVTGSSDMIFTRQGFPVVALNHVLILTAWSGAWLALSYWRRSEREQRKSIAALGYARQAQLEVLRYQLNPHFLFNALASVRALITEHPAQARETVTRLSDFLRSTLHPRSGASATVAEEMQVVRDYLAIEKVRFEDRLQVDLACDTAAGAETLPSFLLHSLVENAVKHGRPVCGRLRIRVAARIHRERLELIVENTGRFLPPPDATGHLGLRNVRDRLAGSYPGRHEFQVGQAGELVRATVAIVVGNGSDGAA
jgi:two-component system, LytTR family, sensor kinase